MYRGYWKIISLTITTELTMQNQSSVQLPRQFVVQRNQSLSWHGNKVFIFYMAIVSLGIASIFALQGLWLILPFAGLEILALALGLYVCCLRGGDREVITVDAGRLLVETGRTKPQQCIQFECAWLQLELKKSPYHGHPSQLLIRSKGREIEIGKCLTNKERNSLADSLVAAIDKPLIRS